ncbi:MAG: alkaline phosphatase family protein [Clostridiales bacterium]|nr:alkaline phosphatase family protein [Clostridiales bacterium]
MDHIRPDYNNCIVNLSNSVLKAFGAETSAPTLPMADKLLEKEYKNVVVLLMDAMGISILEKHLEPDGFLRSHLAGSYSSVFPPTTVATTTSMLSGLYPNEHGWLGWDMYYPELDKNVTVFLNTDQLREDENGEFKPLVPAADFHAGFTYTPYKNIITRINEAGGKAYASMPFLPPFPKDLEAILTRVEDLCREPERKFIYAYWNEPDNTMHEKGPDSNEAHELVIALEKRLEKFASNLSDTLLLITADHSQIECDNYCLLDYPEILKCLVRMPSVEPRALSFWVKDEYKDSFPDIFRNEFGDKFWILTRDEVIENKLFGIGKDHKLFSGMLGDYLAVSVSGATIFLTHKEIDMMPGGHAGLTKEELEIPLIAIAK